VVFAFAIYAFLYGPLFPWSPIKPGYNHLSLARADVYYPQATTPDPAYEFLDRARKEDLVPVIDPAARTSSFDIRFGYLAWRYFLQYLIDTRGRAAFQEFLLADIHRPQGWRRPSACASRWLLS
jgi:hypothetical protein